MAAREHLIGVKRRLTAPHRWVVSGTTLCLFAGLAVGAAAPAGVASAAPTSRTIVFASQRSGNSQIYSVHADGSRQGRRSETARCSHSRSIGTATPMPR